MLVVTNTQRVTTDAHTAMILDEVAVDTTRELVRGYYVAQCEADDYAPEHEATRKLFGRMPGYAVIPGTDFLACDNAACRLAVMDLIRSVARDITSLDVDIVEQAYAQSHDVHTVSVKEVR